MNAGRNEMPEEMNSKSPKTNDHHERGSYVPKKEDEKSNDAHVSSKSSSELLEDKSLTTTNSISVVGGSRNITLERTPNRILRSSCRKQISTDISKNERRCTRQSTGMLPKNRYYQPSRRSQKAEMQVKLEPGTNSVHAPELTVQKYESDTSESSKENVPKNIIQNLSRDNEQNIRRIVPKLCCMKSSANKIQLRTRNKDNRMRLNDCELSRSSISPKHTNMTAMKQQSSIESNNKQTNQVAISQTSTMRHISVQMMPMCNPITQRNHCSRHSSTCSENDPETNIKWHPPAEQDKDIKNDQDVFFDDIDLNAGGKQSQCSPNSHQSSDSDKTTSNIEECSPGWTNEFRYHLCDKSSEPKYKAVAKISCETSVIDVSVDEKSESATHCERSLCRDEEKISTQTQTCDPSICSDAIRVRTADVGIQVHTYHLPYHMTNDRNTCSTSISHVVLGCTRELNSTTEMLGPQDSKEAPWSRQYQRPCLQPVRLVQTPEVSTESKKRPNASERRLTAEKIGRSSLKKSVGQPVKPVKDKGIKRKISQMPVVSDTSPAKKLRSCPKQNNTKRSNKTKPSTRTIRPYEIMHNGHAISFEELNALWLKFCEHGHFRVAPNSQFTETNLTHERANSPIIHRYDPRTYMHSQNPQEISNEQDTSVHTLTSDTAAHTSRYSMLRDSTQRFSNDLIDLRTHTHRSNTISTMAHTYPCVDYNTTTPSIIQNNQNRTAVCEYNPIISENLNSVTDYNQFRTNSITNYSPYSYNNDAHVLGSDLQSSGYFSSANMTNSSSDLNVNSNLGRLSSISCNSTNNTNVACDYYPRANNENYANERRSANDAQLHTPWIDNASNNWSSPTHDSNRNDISMNFATADLMSGGLVKSAEILSPAINNNSNSVMNANHVYENDFMNAAAPRSPLAWHTAISIPNSYTNKKSSYFNDMLEPDDPVVGFDYPRVQSTNLTLTTNEISNSMTPWMPNTMSSSNSALTVSNSGMPAMSSISPEETVGPQRFDPIQDTRGQLPSYGHWSLHKDISRAIHLNMNTSQESLQSPGTVHESIPQERATVYNEKLHGNHLLPFKPTFITQGTPNPTNPDISIDINNFLEVQMNVNEEMYSYQEIPRSTNCGNGTDVSATRISGDQVNSRESEYTKLRQELAEFTRQYVDDPTRSSTRTLNTDDIYSYVLAQEQEMERNVHNCASDLN